MALTVREEVGKRLANLKASRSCHESDWKEVNRLTSSRRSRFLYNNKNTQRNTSLFDAYGITSFRTLQGGLYSGLSSSSRPWFALELEDPDLQDNRHVRIFLDELTKRLQTVLYTSGFYPAIKSNYGEVGRYGNMAGLMEDSLMHGVVCHDLSIGEYWMALDGARKANTLYRVIPMTVYQLVEMIADGGKPDWSRVRREIKQMYDDKKYEQIVPIYHAIETNPDYIEGKLGPEGMKYRSVMWDEADDRNTHVLSERGYHDKIFWGVRWEPETGEVYSSAPGYDVLPDLREMQLQAKRKGEATDWLMYPEKIAPASVKLKNQPKSVVTASTLDKDTVQVPYQIRPDAISAIREDIESLHHAVDRGTYAELFMAITNMQGIQPRNIEEIAARNEEKLTQLGPVVENVNSDGLQVVIDRAIGIMDRGGLLPDASDLPPEVFGQKIKVNFISILTQMQRAVGLGQIERVSTFIGTLAQSFPEARHKLDPFAAINDYAERAGAPATIIRSDDDAAAGVEADARAAQMAQLAEMAPAAREAAGAIKDISSAGEGGE